MVQLFKLLVYRCKLHITIVYVYYIGFKQSPQENEKCKKQEYILYMGNNQISIAISLHFLNNKSKKPNFYTPFLFFTFLN